MLCSAAFAWYVFDYVDATLNVDFDTLKMNFTSIVYTQDSSGKKTEAERLYSDQNRIWVDITKIPKSLQNAFISIEDERFMSHKGVDWKRTVGAILYYVVPSGKSYGGSTITQQLIKNITGEDEVRPDRKVKEILRALDLEKKYSKEQILEMYLNTLFLGGDLHGVQTAANSYFNKDVSQLSLAECASIAAITQFPTKYNPFLHPDFNKERQEVILDKMLELGMITKEQNVQAKAEKLVFAKEKAQVEQKSSQSYFIDQVISDVISDLMTEKGYSKQTATQYLYSGGLSITCTMDPKIQKVMDDVFADEKSYPTIKGSVKPEASMVIMDPRTGFVVGMIGGRGEKTADRTLNRATQTYRSPGSSIKPLSVYAPAIEYGIITYGTVMDDTPFDMTSKYPLNQNRKYSGLTSIKKAVELSLNTLPIKIMDQLTPQKSFDFLQDKVGITSLIKSQKVGNQVKTDLALAPLALGGLTKGVNVMELNAGFSTFVNDGMYAKPITYTQVLDHEGNVVLEKSPKISVAMSEQTSFITRKLLENVVEEGTGTRAQMPSGMPVAGKTGTSDSDFDRWFVGFTPYYLGTVWFGYDKPTEIPTLPYNPALQLWKLVMEKVHANLKVKQFDAPPSGVVQAQYCVDSGMLPGPYCNLDPRGSRIETGWFKKGTEPTEVCNVHVPVDIDSVTGMIANEFCPKENIKTVALLNIRRNVPVDLVVTDAQYVVFVPTPDEIAAGITAPYPGSTPQLAGSLKPMNTICDVHNYDTAHPITELPTAPPGTDTGGETQPPGDSQDGAEGNGDNGMPEWLKTEPPTTHPPSTN